MTNATKNRKKFRATLQGRTVELEVGHEDALIDGRQRTYTAKKLDDDRISLIIDGRSFAADVVRRDDGRYVVHVGGREYAVDLQTEKDLLLERFGLAESEKDGHHEIRAPMPGLVLSLHVKEGEPVTEGDAIVVLEAMKMENELRAATGGTIKSVHVTVGDAVGKNDLLVEIES